MPGSEISEVLFYMTKRMLDDDDDDDDDSSSSGSSSGSGSGSGPSGSSGSSGNGGQGDGDRDGKGKGKLWRMLIPIVLGALFLIVCVICCCKRRRRLARQRALADTKTAVEMNALQKGVELEDSQLPQQMPGLVIAQPINPEDGNAGSVPLGRPSTANNGYAVVQGETVKEEV